MKHHSLLLITGLIAALLSFTACGSINKSVSEVKTPAATVSHEDGQIPLKDFFRNPEAAGFSISPDGSRIAWLAPWKNRMNIFVRELDSGRTARITSATQRDVSGYFWVGNDHLAFGRDSGGDENFHTWVAALDGTGPSDLTPFEETGSDLLDRLENDDEHILITMNKRDKHCFDVYRLNVLNGELQMVARNPGDIIQWVTDNDGHLRAAVAARNGLSVFLYRNNEQEKFHPVKTVDFRTSFSPLCFDFNNRNIYVSTDEGRDKSAIRLFNPETGELGEIIFEHPEVDVSQLLRSKKRKLITGAVYYTDKAHMVFFDEEREEIQNDLESRLPGYEVAVTDMDRDETRMIVRTFSDRSMGAGYIYDSRTKELRRIAEVSPWLDESRMSPMLPVSFRSRDGLTIHGYLTLPAGREAHNLPLLINPHGGPWARDRWGFIPEVQFLASLGIAVMQVNFRGSTGYGREFWEKGFKQWGRNMQNDLSDAVHRLVDKGIADPQRVAIYGGSYGGYAALAGLTFTPDLYACGIDYVGPSNLFTLLETLPPYWEAERDRFYTMIGDPVRDYRLLREVSPVFHAERIKAPLLVAQGANDPRVKKAESDQIVEALRKRGVAVEYMVKDNEGHGFHNEENKFDFYRAMEQFLKQYLLN